MKKLFFLAAIMMLFFSCATLQLSEQNQVFENETGASILYSLRGLYSMGASYEEDADYYSMKSMIEEGAITLIAMDSTEYRAYIEKDEMGYTIYIQNVFSNYNDTASNMAYLTAILSTFAKMEVFTMNAQDNDFLYGRFFEIIEMYQKSYESVTFSGDEWFENKSLKIEGNYIY